MKHFAFTIGMLLLSSLAQAKDLHVTIGGKDLTIPYRVLNHEIGEKDAAAAKQSSALGCYCLYHGLLAQGKIEAASELTTDPAATTRMMTQYRERLGAEDFKKELSAEKTKVLAELTLGSVTMLLVKTQENIAAQLFQIKDGTFVIISGPPFPDEAKTLGKVLTMVQEGNIKL